MATWQEIVVSLQERSVGQVVAPEDINALQRAIIHIGSDYINVGDSTVNNTISNKINTALTGIDTINATLNGDYVEHKDSLTSGTVFGHVKIGANIEVDAGVISIKDASGTDKGVMKVLNSLASTDVNSALSAAQGKVLQDGKVDKSYLLDGDVVKAEHLPYSALSYKGILIYEVSWDGEDWITTSGTLPPNGIEYGDHYIIKISVLVTGQSVPTATLAGGKTAVEGDWLIWTEGSPDYWEVLKNGSRIWNINTPNGDLNGNVVLNANIINAAPVSHISQIGTLNSLGHSCIMPFDSKEEEITNKNIEDLTEDFVPSIKYIKDLYQIMAASGKFDCGIIDNVTISAAAESDGLTEVTINDITYKPKKIVVHFFGDSIYNLIKTGEDQYRGWAFGNGADWNDVSRFTLNNSASSDTVHNKVEWGNHYFGYRWFSGQTTWGPDLENIEVDTISKPGKLILKIKIHNYQKKLDGNTRHNRNFNGSMYYELIG